MQNFVDFNSWLSKFSTGKQVQNVISKLTGEDIKGFLIKDGEYDSAQSTVEFQIVTSDRYIQGAFNLDSKKRENVNCSIVSRKLIDIENVDILLDEQGEDWNPIFKLETYIFTFKDGFKLEVLNNRKSQFNGSFEEFINALLGA
jgi:hypothetical protein